MKKNVVIIIAVVVIIGIISGMYGYSKLLKRDLVGCVGAGKLSFDETDGTELGECCEGLNEIGDVHYREDLTCEEIFMIVGYGSICSDCGNGNCESWENRCNCPDDCE